MTTDFGQRLTVAIAALREGEVVSYGDIVARAGRADSARAVGRFLSKTTNQLPWWRVVYADGRLPPLSIARQTAQLQAEDVVIVNDRVISAPCGRFSAASVIGDPPTFDPPKTVNGI